jgi:hypothetical protein
VATRIPTFRDGAVGIIPIHFDVPAHHLPLKTFIETATQTEAIIAALNEHLFEGKLEYEVLVLAPEDGSFKSKLGVAVAAGAVVWTALSSDIGAGFIKGLTGHEPAYWSELAGVEVGDFFTREAEASAHDAEGLENAITNQTGATIIVESTKSFLQKDVFELTGLGLHPRHIRDAYEARNEFYEACLADTQVRGIGFTDAEEFPIKRSDFARLHVALSPKEQEPDERPWHVAVDAIKVTSPNWARDDKQRQWKGRDSSGRERHFKIEDEEFWQLVAAQQLDPHIFDTMKVQWAFLK